MNVTGIELGPDYCVLVRARRRDVAVEVTAVRIFEPDEWARDVRSRAALLEQARRTLSLPRHATVVAWDLAAFGVTAGEAVLRDAGFTVDHVLAPSDALALLAWSRPQTAPGEPVAWLSINRHGAGIAVVRDHQLVYGAEFAWRIKASDKRAQAHLLRRYLYVAQLVPEMRKAMEVVRTQQGAAIETAVTCGNIPDLRSFTMPLIEQLDIEFETLDSLEGLHVEGALAGEMAQSAPVIRLAGAAAAFSQREAGVAHTGRWLGAAAGLLLAAGAAWWAFSTWNASARVPEAPQRPRNPVVSQARRTAEPPPDATPAPPLPEAAPVATAEKTPPRIASSSTVERPQPRPTTGRSAEPEPERARQVPPPLPTVGGILISKDRRLAVIDGVVVGVGDEVAGRIVSKIDPDAVVFREPSGRHVRVPVRPGPNGTADLRKP